jgi:hypothetical protein
VLAGVAVVAVLGYGRVVAVRAVSSVPGGHGQDSVPERPRVAELPPQMIVAGDVVHDGDPDLAAHVTSAAVRATPMVPIHSSAPSPRTLP